ncbi:MAG: class I SAM-dependent methyltransferase [Nitrospinota bacterium]|nr:MAG: class I SAM-dependent methyltransferase [Nitrospinota bacterium]
MQFDVIAQKIGHLPHMAPKQGRVLYEFILQHDITQCLELGFAHGTSSCYIAAALDEKGEGHLTTIDLAEGAHPYFPPARSRTPNIYELLEMTGLGRYVEPVLTGISYNWELMKIIEAQTRHGVCEPLYDFCYIDGAHTWETDGFAFFLVAKLLKPGGWILFDDLKWSYAQSPGLKEEEWVKRMPEEERCTPQIEKVFNLLVRQHPEFEDFQVMDQWWGWGWARKKRKTLL